MSSQARFRLFLFGGGVLLLGLMAGLVWMGINGRSAPAPSLIKVGLVSDFPPGSATAISLPTTFMDPDAPDEVDASRNINVEITDAPVSPVPIWLVNDAHSGLLALYARDPYRGCHVTWVADKQHFANPCHGQIYSRTGSWLDRPAERSLDRFDVEVVDGEVWVDIGRYQPGQPPLPPVPITDLLKTRPSNSVTIDAYYSGTLAEMIPTPQQVLPGLTCPGLPSNQILADQPLRPWLYLLNGMSSNDPLPTEPWLVAVDPLNDTFDTPALPFYGRLRGHLNDPNFANCANPERIFVVEEVVAVYEAIAPEPGGWPRKPADFDAWPVYGNPMLGFRLSYPPHWQAEVLEEEGLLGGVRFTSATYPDNPITLHVHNGEATPDQYAPGSESPLAKGSLGAGSFMQDDNSTEWPDSQQLDGFVVEWETEPGRESKSVMIVTNGRSYEFTLTYPISFAASQSLLTDFTMMVEGFRTITAVSDNRQQTTDDEMYGG